MILKNLEQFSLVTFGTIHVALRGTSPCSFPYMHIIHIQSKKIAIDYRIDYSMYYK